MKLNEICPSNRYSYEILCSCGKNHQILTQSYNFPEYEAQIYILCECGEYIEFTLPVN